MATFLFGSACGVAFIGIMFAGSMGKAMGKNDRDTATGGLVLALVAITTALVLALTAGIHFGGK